MASPGTSSPTKRVTDMAALQNGAKLFVNHCLSCHAAAFMRYNRLRDIGLTEQQIKDNLIFTGAKVGDTMQVGAADPKDAKDWFGGLPPDLTLIARSRARPPARAAVPTTCTPTCAPTCRDESKATGWDNLALPRAWVCRTCCTSFKATQRAIYADRGRPARRQARPLRVLQGLSSSSQPRAS